ncbi:MAG: S1/P1 nuclease [Bryobacteraceae bacterium]|jgi:S1/P1 nuclease
MRKFRWMAVWLLFLVALPVHAWFNGGHMLVAYIAYQRLTPETRSHVDDLLKLNSMYAQWTAGVPDSQKGVAAFVKAATWPDCIKDANCSPGFTSDGGDNPPGDPTDGQNIGYKDKLMHKYWHYVDLPYSAGAPGEPPKTPNALTQIKLFTQAIGSSESDDVKSYDVVWLEHMIGDVHQPLHSTSRFTKNHPKGDAGGNLVYFCENCKDELHAYWDGLPGDDLTLDQVTQKGDSLLKAGKPVGADNASPSAWIHESFTLAKHDAYASPISSDNQKGPSARPNAKYAATAAKVANLRLRLAGYRLAAVLNNNLK